MRKIRFVFFLYLISGFLFCGCTTEPDHNILWSEEGQAQDEEETEINFMTEDLPVPEEAGISEETAAEEELPEEYPGKTSDAPHVKLTVTDPGYDIFLPTPYGGIDYRYGPSLLLHDDGSMDAWFSAPGDGSKELDYITYRHSPDGLSWEEERVALTPGPGTLDARSVCDPDVFYHDGYYYIGYTSTLNTTNKGMSNSVFLARSENPYGPFEKWDGSGFGGDPSPMICYSGPGVGWGCGEPSFVVINDTVFVYITKDSFTRSLERLRVLQVYTGDLNDPLWPSRLICRGSAAVVAGEGTPDDYIYLNSDSFDVAYVEENGMFVAVCSNRRFKNDSCLLLFESRDGLRFERVSELNTNVICGCHNAGILGDGQAHIRKNAPAFIGYAYTGYGNSSWGVWGTRLSPIRVEPCEEIDRSEDGASNLKLPLSHAREGTDPLMVGAKNLISTAPFGASSFGNSYYVQERSGRKLYPKASELSFFGYDERILSVENGEPVPKNPGDTTAWVGYTLPDGTMLSRPLRFHVEARNAEAGKSPSSLTKLMSASDHIDISLSDPFLASIRPIAQFGNLSLRELAESDYSDYGIKAVSLDWSVCMVDKNLNIVPLSEGLTTVTVTSRSGKNFRVTIHITE